MNKFTADRIFLSDGRIHNDKAIITDANGRILDVIDKSDTGEDVQHLNGLLVPGFINTHCHLELSHMKGKVNTGTGLIPFIESVVTTRGAGQEEIQNAIEQAEGEMFNSGIVAVGDISNQVDTFRVKSAGKLRYYTFIECFDFMQEEKGQETFDQYKAVFDQINLAEGSKISLVPHAPYSVSDTLYRLIHEANADDDTISIHNQETPPENELFFTGSGGFVDFYRSFGVELKGFTPTGRSSIHSALPHLNPKNRNLFVHNTLTTEEDIIDTQKALPNTFWATCANANLYIENRLPNYQNFLNTNAKLTIGTDSLTSNWQLNVLEELKTIQKFQSYVPLETLLTWATINGAKALGFDDTLGSFEKGKTPGIVLIEGMSDNNLKNTTSKRII